MKAYEEVSPGHYEEMLRSVGSSLDEDGVQDVALIEVEAGFLMTGHRAVEPKLWTSGPQHRWAYAESTVRHSAVVQASDRGVKRRGSSYRARRYGHALRLIGRRVDEEEGSRIIIVDKGDRFLLRMLYTADATNRSVELRTSDLDRMKQEALQARRAETASRSHA